MMKKILSIVLIICMLASLAFMFSINTAATDEWTFVNFSTAKKFAGNNVDNSAGGTWSFSNDGCMATLTPSSTVAYNVGLYDTEHTLEKGKEYVISVDMKFSKSYYSSGTTVDGTASLSNALIFGINGVSDTVTPWNANSGASCYAAMFSRSNTKANANILRVFQIAKTKGQVETNTKMGTDAMEAAKSSTDWINVQIHVTKNGTFHVYFNGTYVSGSVEKAYWNGGHIGVVTHTARSTDPVSFQNLKFKEITNKVSSDNNIASAYWNDVDMSALTSTYISGTWTYNEGVLTATAAPSNNVNMTSVRLDAGKAYTIEMEARFDEAYKNASTDSKGIGLVFDSATNVSKNAWGTNDRYCAMVDRSATTAIGASVFGGGVGAKYITSTRRYDIGRALTADEKATTDWLKLRVTMDERGSVTFYLNGEQVGQTLDAKNNGGYLGVIAYNATSKVHFRNLRYTEGIVDENKVDYIGTSVRIDEFSGIRVKSAISAELTSATVAEDGFKVVEYGTLVAKADNYKTTAMTVGAAGVQKAIAYNATTDTYFERNENETVYTIVLHNISNINQEYAFRAYYVVEYADGTTETFYQTYNGSYNLVKSLSGVATQIKADPNATEDELAYANKILGN